jgi:uncharacterized repeat protein (TIGR03803 family)
MVAKLLLAFLVLPVLCSGQAYTFSTPVNFSSAKKGPYYPSDLIIDSAGNLYSTSAYGGHYNYGTVFKVTPDGVVHVLHSFAGPPADGSYPYGALTRDKSGNLYGITYFGGTEIDCNGYAGCGTVFKVTPEGQETVLYNFTDTSDGGLTQGTLTLDSKGDMYGVAEGDDPGLVFKLTPADVFSTVYDFGQYIGTGATLIMDKAGNLYGTTYQGGEYATGTVFELTPEGEETTLYTFTGGTDGKYPNSKLTQDAAGNLYGSALGGGTADGGVVFKISSTRVYSVLYSFCQLPNCADGQLPNGWLTLDSAGNLYGITENSGPYVGVVFKVTPSGVESVLYVGTYTFGQASDQGTALVMDKSGNLYGSYFAGGTSNQGMIFKLTKN